MPKPSEEWFPDLPRTTTCRYCGRMSWLGAKCPGCGEIVREVILRRVVAGAETLGPEELEEWARIQGYPETGGER